MLKNDLIEQWLTGFSRTTQSEYRTRLNMFCSFAEIKIENLIIWLCGDKTETSLTLRSYRASLLQKSLQPQTIESRLNPIYSLHSFLREMEIVDWKLRRPKRLKVTPYRDTAGPGIDVIREMIQSVENSQDFKG